MGRLLVLWVVSLLHKDKAPHSFLSKGNFQNHFLKVYRCPVGGPGRGRNFCFCLIARIQMDILDYPVCRKATAGLMEAARRAMNQLASPPPSTTTPRLSITVGRDKFAEKGTVLYTAGW